MGLGISATETGPPINVPAVNHGGTLRRGFALSAIADDRTIGGGGNGSAEAVPGLTTIANGTLQLQTCDLSVGSPPSPAMTGSRISYPC